MRSPSGWPRHRRRPVSVRNYAGIDSEFFNSNASALQSDLYNAKHQLYAATPSQQAQLDALNSATSSGDFAGALAALANQLAVDSRFFRHPEFQRSHRISSWSGATITLGSTWQPASLVIDSADVDLASGQL